MKKAYLAESVIGIFVFNDNGDLITKSLAPFDLDNNVEYLLALERGDETQQIREILEYLKKEGYDTVVVESETTGKIVSNYGLKPIIEPSHLGMIKLREKLVEFAIENNFAKDSNEFYRKLHDIMLELTRRKLRKEAAKRDLLAVQAIRAIDDIDKTINLYMARLREWYSIHFPELDDLVKEHEEYAKLVYEIGHRSNYTVDKIVELGFSRELAEKIVNSANNSIGAELSDFDIEYIKTLAGIIIDLYNLRRTLDNYIDAVMKEVAPNVTALVGSKLGARLLSLAGDLETLAKLPASTIQVLGAEKALFRALRTGGKPPKHGVIFQYPAIHKSPRWQRGKIARALAAKLAIAAKIDFFTGRFTGDKLVKELEKRIEEIKQLYPKPPPRKETPREFKRKGKKSEG
ncbi:MAG: C/D box methylation guide ribonucleoprotein complex aNOP56 subunit [Desulfurococcaceae archaeon]